MPSGRRDFLKIGAVGGAAAVVFGFDLKPAFAELRQLKIARANETRATCPYCSVSCGVIIYSIGGPLEKCDPQVVHVEGDPDHPINRGTLCPKGASLEQDIVNDRRLLKPQVRRRVARSGKTFHGTTRSMKSRRESKKTRDDTFIETDRKKARKSAVESIAWTGGCTDTNEFNYRGGKTDARAGGRSPGKSGQSLTRPHGLKFGTNVRTRRDDDHGSV
jgi:formate dehydrogenase major subunit